MKESFIVVTEASVHDVENAVMDFANLYPDNRFADVISIYKGTGWLQFIITFPGGCDWETFAFCVNYIRYSKKKGEHKPVVDGYFHLPGSELPVTLSGEFVHVSVAENDTAFDNVDIVDGNGRAWLFDFGKGYIEKGPGQSFPIPETDKEKLLHIIDAVRPPKQETSAKPWWKFW